MALSAISSAVEQLSYTQLVAGSNPASRIACSTAHCLQYVEIGHFHKARLPGGS